MWPIIVPPPMDRRYLENLVIECKTGKVKIPDVNDIKCESIDGKFIVFFDQDDDNRHIISESTTRNEGEQLLIKTKKAIISAYMNRKNHDFTGNGEILQSDIRAQLIS